MRLLPQTPETARGQTTRGICGTGKGASFKTKIELAYSFVFELTRPRSYGARTLVTEVDEP